MDVGCYANVSISAAGGAAAAERAAVVAGRLNLPWTRDAPDRPLVLEVGDDGLALRVAAGEPRLVGGRPVRVDFARLDTTSGPGRSLRLPLLKAAGIRKGDPWRPRVLDATAGLGEDAWLLAAAGCAVIACERHRVLWEMLRDALERAEALAPETAGRITLSGSDAGDTLRDGAEQPEVVLIDPMYPGRAKRKTAERKPMAVLRMLVGEDADADRLLGPALARASRRVLVKRPRGAAPLAGRPPTAVHEARGHRFDVYAVGG